MNSDRLHGRWKRFKGSVGAWVGRLLHNPTLIGSARRLIRAGRLQEAYGRGRDCSERWVAEPRPDSLRNAERSLRARNG